MLAAQTMSSQHRHNLSLPYRPSRGSQATSMKKPNKHQKNAPSVQSSHRETVTHHVPAGFQQSILDVFTLAFPVASQVNAFAPILQEVKGHLYNRDFLAAFGKPEYLDVYASRWSAARALAYADIFMSSDRHLWFQPPTSPSMLSHVDNVQPLSDLNQDPGSLTASRHLGLTEDHTGHTQSHVDDSSKSSGSVLINQTAPTQLSQISAKAEPYFKIACLGGGAGAELVALAATWRYLNSNHDMDSKSTEHAQSPNPRLDILAIDVADWSEPVSKLSSAITTPPSLSKHASQTVRDTNRALIQPETDGIINISFKQQDVLDVTLSSLQSTLSDISLVTIMFTLNELFTSSLSKTTTLLLNLTNSMNVGAHLVVVDSPGSYSEIKLGKSTSENRDSGTANAVKKYPMKWLLDHTLLEVVGKGEDTRWVKVEDEDSKWFRIDEKMDLKYSIELENCRYQIHAFRKVK